MPERGGEFVEGVVLKPFGLPYHLAKKMEEPLRLPAGRFPNRMGWVAKWYDATFGPEHERKGGGGP